MKDWMEKMDGWMEKMDERLDDWIEKMDGWIYDNMAAQISSFHCQLFNKFPQCLL